MEYICNINRCK